jgi:hypothetical protein
MKGISATLLIIVSAIVILIAALVVLTIFGSGITPIVDLTNGRNLCLQQVAQSCTITGDVPPTWNAATMNVKEGDKILSLPCSDAKLANCKTCQECGITVPS